MTPTGTRRPSAPDTTGEAAGLRARLRHYRRLAEQLQHALDRRMPIEQAKGILAERYGIGVEEAYVLLRAFCRNHNRKISDVAELVVLREPLDVPELEPAG